MSVVFLTAWGTCGRQHCHDAPLFRNFVRLLFWSRLRCTRCCVYRAGPQLVCRASDACTIRSVVSIVLAWSKHLPWLLVLRGAPGLRDMLRSRSLVRFKVESVLRRSLSVSGARAVEGGLAPSEAEGKAGHRKLETREAVADERGFPYRLGDMWPSALP